MKWFKVYPHPEYIFDIREVKLNNIYLTLAALLKFNKDQTDSSQEEIAQNIQEHLENAGKNISNETVSRIFTDSNKYLK